MTSNRNSKHNPNNISIKKDYIVNPVTGRLIKVNSRKYVQLVKDAILHLPHSDRKNTIVYEGGNVSDVAKGLRTDDNHILVAKNDKVFKQRRKLENKDYINHTLNKCVDLIKNDLGNINIHEMTNDELDEHVRELLNQKLIMS